MQFRHTGKNALHPRKLLANMCPVFSVRCGHILLLLWEQPVRAQLRLEAVVWTAWVSKTGGASVLHYRPALQWWAPGEGTLCICMVLTKLRQVKELRTILETIKQMETNSETS